MLNVNDFLKFLQYEKRYSLHTITAYRNDLAQLQLFLTKNYEMNDLLQVQHIHLRSWLVSLMEEKIVARSINRKLSTLKTYYKFQLKKGAIDFNPMSKVIAPKTSKRLPVFIQKNQIQRMWDHYEFGNDFKGARNRIVMEIFYATGMRVSELVNLRDESFDKYNSSLKVLGKGNKERIIPLNASIRDIVNEYIQLRNSNFKTKEFKSLIVDVKGGKMYSRSIYRIVNTILKTVSTVEKKSPHVLRHTFATHMLNNGAEINAIKELLGHSSLAATQVYTHNTIEKLKDVYQKAHPKAHID